MLTWKERDELRRLATRATPGPWWVEHEKEGRDAYIAHGTKGDPTDTYDLLEVYNVETDYAYIAAVQPDTILQLLDDIDVLLARLEEGQPHD